MALITPQTGVVTPSISRDTGVADLGSYYIANTVPGTGIIGHAAPVTFDETKAAFYLFNGGNLSIYPLFLKLTMTVLPVGNTMQKFTTTLDQGNKYASGGTTLPNNASPGIFNVNLPSASNSAAQIVVGAPLLSAATSSRRLVSHRPFRPTVIGVVGDVYQFNWGSGELVDPSGLPNDGTLRAHVMYTIAPLVVSPGTNMAIYAWGATFSTGATYEYEFGYVER